MKENPLDRLFGRRRKGDTRDLVPSDELLKQAIGLFVEQKLRPLLDQYSTGIQYIVRQRLEGWQIDEESLPITSQVLGYLQCSDSTPVGGTSKKCATPVILSHLSLDSSLKVGGGCSGSFPGAAPLGGTSTLPGRNTSAIFPPFGKSYFHTFSYNLSRP